MLSFWTGMVGCTDSATLSVDAAASEIVTRLGWSGEGLLLIGEQHKSVLSVEVAATLVQQGFVDCMFIERPDYPVSMDDLIDRRLYQPRSMQKKKENIDARFDGLFWDLRAASVAAFGVDDRLGDREDHDRDQLIAGRNEWMAAAIDGAVRAGPCSGAVMLGGFGHLGRSDHGPSGDLAPLVESYGHEVTTMIVIDDTVETTRFVELEAWSDDLPPDRHVACVRRKPRWSERSRVSDVGWAVRAACDGPFSHQWGLRGGT